MASPISLLIVTATLGRSHYFDDVLRDIDMLAGRIPLTHVIVAPELARAELRGRRPNAIVITEPSGIEGLYGAVNAGVAALPEWGWMTYINDDDRLWPGFEALWRVATEESRFDIVYGKVDYLNGAGAVVAQFPICRRTSDVPALLAGGVAPFTQQGTLVNRSSWDRLGGFDPALRLAADFDFWVRAAGAGMRFGYITEKVAGFRIHAGQLSGNVQQVRSEILTVLSRGLLRSTWYARVIALIHFRVTNAPRIFFRILRTGRARTRRLLARGT